MCRNSGKLAEAGSLNRLRELSPDCTRTYQLSLCPPRLLFADIRLASSRQAVASALFHDSWSRMPDCGSFGKDEKLRTSVLASGESSFVYTFRTGKEGSPARIELA